MEAESEKSVENAITCLAGLASSPNNRRVLIDCGSVLLVSPFLRNPNISICFQAAIFFGNFSSTCSVSDAALISDSGFFCACASILTDFLSSPPNTADSLYFHANICISIKNLCSYGNVRAVKNIQSSGIFNVLMDLVETYSIPLVKKKGYSDANRFILLASCEFLKNVLCVEMSVSSSNLIRVNAMVNSFLQILSESATSALSSVSLDLDTERCADICIVLRHFEEALNAHMMDNILCASVVRILLPVLKRYTVLCNKKRGVQRNNVVDDRSCEKLDNFVLEILDLFSWICYLGSCSSSGGVNNTHKALFENIGGLESLLSLFNALKLSGTVSSSSSSFSSSSSSSSDSPPVKMKSSYFCCDVCEKSILDTGVRYSCEKCYLRNNVSYDICEKCEKHADLNVKSHSPTHSLIRYSPSYFTSSLSSGKRFIMHTSAFCIVALLKNRVPEPAWKYGPILQYFKASSAYDQREQKMFNEIKNTDAMLANFRWLEEGNGENEVEVKREEEEEG